MDIDQQISKLLELAECVERKTKTLIFVVGENARSHIENNLKSSPGMQSSVAAVASSRQDIDVLFLSRLQYLFMYLMKFEAEEMFAAIKYNHFVIYGLDQGICTTEPHEGTEKIISSDQARLCNLICNAAFRIKRKHDLLDVVFIPWDKDSRLAKEVTKIERYWRRIC